MRYLKENTQNALVQLATYLTTNHLTISCAESCTGGGLAYAFTSLPGSSAWFKHSVVTYSNEAKQAMVGVSEETLAQYGAVSAQTVAEMALGVVSQVGADIGISISGIAGPDGGSTDKPVGTVWFGFVVNDVVNTKQLCFAGDRDAVRLQSIEYAIEQVVHLLSIHK
ncbi:CinA family protein [Glaciecola sp. HTCC2999]|jgi:nicotinamide-nucleotide amidase|uniref:CinA family protein n=1 Tax=Glaciecola sp. HTCC2999 TaxID=455436 RepID=UPI0000E0E57C|nr:nicotinamide-nucleotide amidohydrolase family protein [Glaciecola sp. HTCC2999]